MYERFTDRAQKVMRFANQEAQRYNHEFIGTEHILLGLIKEGSGTAVLVLESLNIDLHQIKLLVEKLIQAGPEMIILGKLPQKPPAKKVIEYAMEEARNLNHKHVGTEHLLLGLIREEGGIASQVLRDIGLTIEKVRMELLWMMAREGDLNIVGPALSNLAILYCRLAREVGCADEHRREVISILHEMPYREELKQVVARAFSDLQTRREPRVLLSAVLHKALQIAISMSHRPVELLHIFMALVCEAKGAVRDALVQCGCTEDVLRDAVVSRFKVHDVVPSAETMTAAESALEWLLFQVTLLEKNLGRVGVAELLLDCLCSVDVPVPLPGKHNPQVLQFLSDRRIDMVRLKMELQEAQC